MLLMATIAMAIHLDLHVVLCGQSDEGNNTEWEGDVFCGAVPGQEVMETAMSGRKGP